MEIHAQVGGAGAVFFTAGKGYVIDLPCIFWWTFASFAVLNIATNALISSLVLPGVSQAGNCSFKFSNLFKNHLIFLYHT